MTPLAFIHLFADGFRAMTLGRTLWVLVAVKLVVLFALIKPVFFRDELGRHAKTPAQKSAFVAQSLAQRAAPAAE
ncbi:MAG: DUF4492 domain-containing protein [Puniceicoccales bacterium]|jgi:hypothetical protein|nr:DUF4492 domain-containing protein [Puniceicoccales bacterium]